MLVEDGRVNVTDCVGSYYRTFADFNVLDPMCIVVI
jgi:hypothetical protein